MIDRKQLYTMLTNMHACGVLHGDFRPPNVLFGPRGPVLIDFSHSKLAHICPPDGSCWELRDAQHQLKLADNDLDRKGAYVASQFRAFFHHLSAGLLVRNGGRVVGATRALLAVATVLSLIS
jgi:serine/threonine protein kinase